MNEKFGADLGEADRVWVDQQWAVVKENIELRTVAQHNDRSAFGLVLEQRLAEMLLDRHERTATWSTESDPLPRTHVLR